MTVLNFQGKFYHFPFSFHPFSVGVTSLKRICSPRNKFFPLRVDFFLEVLQPPVEVTEVVSLCKYGRKRHDSAPVYLKGKIDNIFFYV